MNSNVRAEVEGTAIQHVIDKALYTYENYQPHVHFPVSI